MRKTNRNRRAGVEEARERAEEEREDDRFGSERRGHSNRFQCVWGEKCILGRVQTVEVLSPENLATLARQLLTHTHTHTDTGTPAPLHLDASWHGCWYVSLNVPLARPKLVQVANRSRPAARHGDPT